MTMISGVDWWVYAIVVAAVTYLIGLFATGYYWNEDEERRERRQRRDEVDAWLYVTAIFWPIALTLVLPFLILVGLPTWGNSIGLKRRQAHGNTYRD